MDFRENIDGDWLLSNLEREVFRLTAFMEYNEGGESEKKPEEWNFYYDWISVISRPSCRYKENGEWINDCGEQLGFLTVPVTEPSTYILFGTGMLGLVWYRRKQVKA